MMHELVPVMLRHGAPTVVDDRDKAEQEGGQGATTAQQLQPPVTREVLALQGAVLEGEAGQHGAEQRRVNGIQQSMQGWDPAADDERADAAFSAEVMVSRLYCARGAGITLRLKSAKASRHSSSFLKT
jgi:hypothetical protein